MPRRPVHYRCFSLVVLWCLGLQTTLFESLLHAEELQQRFTQEIQPFLRQYCDHCHSGESAEAKFLTTQFDHADATVALWQSWDEVIRRVAEQEMPPSDEPQPSAAERQKLLQWSNKFQQQQAEKFRGDPGSIPLRRLNAAEWNNSIRDLVGYDIQAAKDFPIDPANAAGFDNSAESLTMSPGVLNKFAQSARYVAEHMLLTPDSVRFAPFPVVTDTDRDRYCVQRIVDFYRQQPTELLPYLLAARTWRLATNQGSSQTIEKFATANRLSPKYLTLLLDALQDSSVHYGPLFEVQNRWESLINAELPPAEVQQRSEEIRRYIVGQRERLIPPVENLRAPGGINGGSQPLVLWKNRQMAQNRMKCRADGFTADLATSVFPLELRDKYPTLPATEQVKIHNDYEKFCRLFPDEFYIAERGRAHIDPKAAAREAKGRLLSAGFHSMMGYFRDDQPLYELILSPTQQRELDQLWEELEFIAQVPLRQYAGHLWFERAEASFLNDERFDFVRAEDKNAASSEMIQRFASVYIEKLMEKDAKTEVVSAVENYFAEMDQRLRKLESQREASQTQQLESLVTKLEYLFRRPIDENDKQIVRDFYRLTLASSGEGHRAALEDTLVFMLLSPSHLYRMDLATNSLAPTPLLPHALASRWSFFLWASPPAQELRQSAQQGDLTNPEKVQEALQRMVQDDRIEGMAKEFLGNWLDFRRFETHNGVDRQQFPEFDDTLRQAMFEEPIQTFIQLIRKNGKLIELIKSDYVVVNEPLANYLGLQDRYHREDQGWQRIENISDSQRGGLIPMGIFLTQNSPGLRTSPVKRGYWIVRKILGEKIPAPPPNVPELPDSEHDLGALTLREVLEKHREHPSCASCHARFDSFGLLLEGFDPVGRPRSVDLAGHPISSDAPLPDGSQAQGLKGLQEYILTRRADDFRRNFCEKLIAFALGRSLILSDRLLVEDMLSALRENDDRIQAAFVALLQSSQFRTQRNSTSDQESEHVTQ